MGNVHKQSLQMSESSRSRLHSDIHHAIEWLAQFGQVPEGGVTRLLYTPAWQLAQQALETKMGQLGLAPYYDDCGNLYGRLPGTDRDAGVLLTGSHVDTVNSGGKFDGAYGILAGMLALQYLRETCGSPRRTIEVVSFCEEEGSRFPLTYWGSGNIAGRYSLGAVPEVADKEGVTLAGAMRQAGFGQNRYPLPERNDITEFIELHIEQGFVLEKENKTIGIVEGIVGQRRYTVRVKGTANHAGTTPMKYRHDALAGACAMVNWVEQRAQAEPEPFVSTVGQLEVLPNSSNVIPGQVSFTVDVRDSVEERLAAFCLELRQSMASIAGARDLCVEVEEWMNMAPVRMNPAMNAELAAICEAKRLPWRHMFSGAGHDTQVISRICPSTMLFVPSHKGISHSPLESSSTADLAAGAEVLAEWLYKRAY
ncbi:MAG: allantoate amidohydrolase [Paenibacillaceae bacterium]|jgi:allantoate deiminase|nr:allantoate amidohydrolase [Paenibacillaceae bacterium]